MTCKLCKSNEADQTGSHIISAFLLVSQIGKRGEEKSHLITTEPTQDYSENRKDKDIKEDYILCRDCEKRLSFVEDIFSSEITNKIEIDKFNANFIRFNTERGFYLQCIRPNPIAFHLLVYSVIWRASISKKTVYNHFILSSDVEEELRFFLDLFLPTFIDHKITLTQEKWEKMVENCQDIFSYFPYLIVKAEKLTEKSGTFQFFDNVTKNPYHIMINEYIILPFFNSLQFSDDFFEIKEQIDYIDLLNNNYDFGKIGILKNSKYESMLENIRILIAEEKVINLRKYFLEELTSKGLPIDLLDSMVMEHLNKTEIK